MITALGIDPGLRATGYAVLRGDRQGLRISALGVLHTTQADLFQRLRTVFEATGALLREHRPEVVILEDLFAHQVFPRAALDLAHLRGVIALAATLAGAPVETLAPAAVKRALTGSGRAGKGQVQAMVRTLLRLAEAPDDHAADAAALALTVLSRRGALLRVDATPVEARA